MFGLFPNSLLTIHQGQAGRLLSPRLWTHVNGQALSPDGFSKGFFVGDDFLNLPYVAATGMCGGYAVYIEDDATVGSVGQVTGFSGGVAKLLTSKDTSDGDNHDTILTAGGGKGVFGALSRTAGADKLTIFEARIQLPTVTNGQGSYFVGLTEEGLNGEHGVMADSSGHVLASKDMIGFAVFEDDNDALKFVYRKAGQAAQTLFSYGTALAANTWYNLGFVYNPTAPASEKIRVYINNAAHSTAVTDTQMAAATFPNGEGLTFTASVKGSANNAPRYMLLDGWAFWQAG